MRNRMKKIALKISAVKIASWHFLWCGMAPKSISTQLNTSILVNHITPTSLFMVIYEWSLT